MGNISKYFHFNVNSLTEEEDEVFAKSSVFFFCFFFTVALTLIIKINS